MAAFFCCGSFISLLLIAMKQAKKFFTTTLIGGVLVILPITILVVVFSWVFRLIQNLVHPISEAISANAIASVVMKIKTMTIRLSPGMTDQL